MPRSSADFSKSLRLTPGLARVIQDWEIVPHEDPLTGQDSDTPVGETNDSTPAKQIVHGLKDTNVQECENGSTQPEGVQAAPFELEQRQRGHRKSLVVLLKARHKTGWLMRCPLGLCLSP